MSDLMKSLSRAAIADLSQTIEQAIYKSAAVAILDPELFEQVNQRVLTLDEAYELVEPTKPKSRIERVVTLFNLMSTTEQKVFLSRVAPGIDWQPTPASS